jgi:glycosyltransferase involved in cell wall biosynthesis
MRRKRRILFLEPKRYLGAEFTVQTQLIRHLDRDQVEVFVACQAGAPWARTPTWLALRSLPDITLLATSFGPSVTNEARSAILRSAVESGVPALWSLPRLALFARRQRIDIVHSGMKPRDAFFGVALARLSGARSVVHLHSQCAEWMRPLTRWGLAHADAVLGVSQTAAQSAVSFVGAQPERVYSLRNGMDLSRWDTSIDGVSLREELAIPADAPVIVAVARICPWKGLAELIQALAAVRRSLPAARLLIVGGDDLAVTPGRKSYTRELQQLAQETGQEDHVTFAGHRTDIPRVLAAADVFALLSPDEGFGMAYLEAMAMKKPAIALNVGGPNELIEDGKSGFLIQPGDPEQAERVLLELLSDPARRAEMGAYGRRRVEAHYAIDLVARDLVDIYDQILAAPSYWSERRVVTRQPSVAS